MLVGEIIEDWISMWFPHSKAALRPLDRTILLILLKRWHLNSHYLWVLVKVQTGWETRVSLSDSGRKRCSLALFTRLC
jgi:hypothetical protein